MSNSPATVHYQPAVLVYIENSMGELLLLNRNREPNIDYWSPIGGKLDPTIGESPFECAVRETLEETGFHISTEDLSLFAIVTEIDPNLKKHWILYLFKCRKKFDEIPPPHPEGSMAYFSLKAFDGLKIPPGDSKVFWPAYFDKDHRFSLITLKGDWGNTDSGKLEITHEAQF